MIRNILLSVFVLSALPFPLLSQSGAETKTPTYAKAQNCLIEEINFDKAELSDALVFFAKESAARDPEKKGLNFVLKEPSDPGQKTPALTLNLKKIPLSEVLKYVAALTNYQLKYEQHAILLIPPETLKTP